MENKLVYREEDEFFKILFLKKYLIGTYGFIAGGCFKNIFNNEQIKDIDVFFRNKEDFEYALETYENNELFDKCYKNKNVVAFKENKTGIVVELICKEYYDPKQILNDFDFSITKFCYYFEKEQNEEGDTEFYYYVIHHDKFFEHLLHKRLVIDDENLLYPFGTFNRTYRYAKYGYQLCLESKKNLINAIRNSETFDDSDLGKSLYDGID